MLFKINLYGYTPAAYHDCREDRGEWPSPAGRLAPPAAGSTYSSSHPRILPGGGDGARGAGYMFDALDHHLKAERRRLRDVFDECDYNKDCGLDGRDLSRAYIRPLLFKPRLSFFYVFTPLK